MQEQLKRMQEQMRILVEESMNSKSRKSKHTSKKVRQWSPFFLNFPYIHYESYFAFLHEKGFIFLYWIGGVIIITCSLKKAANSTPLWISTSFLTWFSILFSTGKKILMSNLENYSNKVKVRKFLGDIVVSSILPKNEKKS